MAPFIKQSPLSCPGHTRPVVDICFSGIADCGALFVSAAKDGKVILRRGDTGDWIGTFHGHKGAVWSCVLDKFASKVASGAADFTAKIWDAVSGKQLLTITEDHIVRCVDFTKKDMGAKLLTANNHRKISVYDLESSQSPLVVLEGHNEIIRRALWCNGDKNIISVSEDRTLKLWDLSTSNCKPVCTHLWSKQMPNPVTDIQFRLPSSNEHLDCLESVVACGNTALLYVHDWRYVRSEPNDPVSTFTLPCTINTASLHPTEKLVVCGGVDHLIYRLNLESAEILETCKGHFGPLHCVRFSPDGHIFTSGSEDGTVRLWQTVVGSDFGLWKLNSIVECEMKTEPSHVKEDESVLSTVPA